MFRVCLSGGAADQNVVDLLGGCHFITAADGANFACETFESGFIKLALGVALLALIIGAMQVTYDFCNGNQVALVDLLLILLRTAGPHRTFDFGFAFEGLHRVADHIGA